MPILRGELFVEMSALSQIGTLAKYGPPFAPHANGPNSKPVKSTLDVGFRLVFDPDSLDQNPVQVMPILRGELFVVTILELQREMSALSQIGTLAKYGPPFAPHANGPNSKPVNQNKY
jgi:hypothetical protein